MTLVPALPATAVKVAESGIGGKEDLVRLSRAGFDAFLVGESLLLAKNPGRILRGLVEAGSAA